MHRDLILTFSTAYFLLDIYHQKGSLALIESLANELRQQHRNPFCIPVGGSNALGSFGYINAVAEIIEDCVKNGLSEFDHIVFSCGSGGTAAGIALGVKLAGLRTKVWGRVGRVKVG